MTLGASRLRRATTAWATPATVLGRDAGRGDLGRHRRRVVGALGGDLRVAPEVGLDVQVDGPPRDGGEPVEGLQLEEERAHGLARAQVEQVALGLVGDGDPGLGLAQLVEAEDRQEARGLGVGDVLGDERAVAVGPAGPALAGVHAAGEVVVAGLHRGRRPQVGGAVLDVAHADRQVARPAHGKRRRGARRGRAEQGRGGQGGEQHEVCAGTRHHLGYRPDRLRP
jgi:hypothetical protein